MRCLLCSSLLLAGKKPYSGSHNVAVTLPYSGYHNVL